MNDFPVDTLWVSLALAMVLGLLIGLLFGPRGERAYAVFACMAVGGVIWFWGWVIFIAVHFISLLW